MSLNLSFAGVTTWIDIDPTQNGMFGSHVAKTQDAIIFNTKTGEYEPLSAIGNSEKEAFKRLCSKFTELAEGTIVKSPDRANARYQKIAPNLWRELGRHEVPKADLPAPYVGRS